MLHTLSGLKEDNKSMILQCYKDLFHVYKEEVRNYPKALEYALKKLKIQEEFGDKDGMANSTIDIGNCYGMMDDYPKAQGYFLKALDLFDKLGNPHPERDLIISSNVAVIYQRMNNYQKTIEYTEKAKRKAEKMRDSGTIANMNGNMSLVYTKLKNYPLAIQYGRQSLELANRVKDSDLIATAMYEIGNALLLMAEDSSGLNFGKNKTSKTDPSIPENKTKCIYLSLDYLKQALQLKDKIEDATILISIYNDLSRAYKLNGDYKISLEIYQKYIDYRDSAYSSENAKKMVQTQMQNDFDKKEVIAKNEQDKKETRQRIIRNSIAGGLAGALIFLFVVYRQRNKIKKEKQRSEELLLNILPEEVAEELKAKGSADAKLMDQVTVLFTDFKGFTELSEKMSPKDLVAEINECFSAFDMIMEKYGIEKIKTIGDAYMAAGGLPTANKTHPEDVVNAALEIQEYMLQHKLKREAQNKLFFEIRIGINTGPVVAGIVGVKKFQYDIWGDTVNTASRMESSGEAGKVNISGTTYELVKDKFICTHRGKIQAKGKGEVDMYFVEGVKS